MEDKISCSPSKISKIFHCPSVNAWNNSWAMQNPSPSSPTCLMYGSLTWLMLSFAFSHNVLRPNTSLQFEAIVCHSYDHIDVFRNTFNGNLSFKDSQIDDITMAEGFILVLFLFTFNMFLKFKRDVLWVPL